MINSSADNPVRGYVHLTWWEAYTYAVVRASTTGFRYRVTASRANPGRWLVARVLPIRPVSHRQR